jgi:hypothetical protein
MPRPITLHPHDREVLARALTDAIFYRDPPVYCAACQALQGSLCEQCTDTFARARAYVDLGRELGIDVSH